MLTSNIWFARSLSVCFGAVLPLTALTAACSSDESSPSEQVGGDAAIGGEQASGGSGASEGGVASGASSSSGGVAAAGENTGASGQTASGGAAETTIGPAPVDLGTASNYAIVAKSAISNVPTSVVTGDVALSPAAASYITGFALTKAGTSWTSAQVTGLVFAANNDPPTPAQLTTAVGDMLTAYADAAGRAAPDFLNLGAGEIGGLTLVPGLYKWTSTLSIPTDITLAGSEDAVWIFQISGDLKLSADKQMILSGGALPQNVYWQVAGVAELGTTSHAEGIVLSKTAIKLGTGASINGRLLAQTAVSLAGATVTAP
ncbi:MAG TPA: ice-binding family protein [Polyangiaceae bacterium]|nr:ice-binding family protein [Polyangiaceae bacterium]